MTMKQMKCCCGEPEIEYTFDCSQCGDPGIATCWEVAVAGVTDNTCSECDEEFNGTFTLWHAATHYPSLNTRGGCEYINPWEGTPPCFLPSGSSQHRIWMNNSLGISPPGTCPSGGSGRWWIVFGNGLATYVSPDYGFQSGGFGTECDIQEVTFTRCHTTATCATWPTTITITAIPCPT